MKLINYLFLFILVLTLGCSKGELDRDEVKFSGIVRDADTDKPISGAVVNIVDNKFLVENPGLNQQSVTNNNGAFEIILKKKAYVSFEIISPNHLDYHGCLNFQKSCDHPDNEVVFDYTLKPAATIRINIVSSNQALKKLSGRGADHIYIGEFINDTTFYKKIKPDHTYNLKWFVYESQFYHSIDLYESPQELSFTPAKFDTIVFDIHF